MRHSKREKVRKSHKPVKPKQGRKSQPNLRHFLDSVRIASAIKTVKDAVDWVVENWPDWFN